jgi:hypothetical protein
MYVIQTKLRLFAALPSRTAKHKLLRHLSLFDLHESVARADQSFKVKGKVFCMVLIA